MNPKPKNKNLEIFCGPNGAGKSTLADMLRKKRGKLNLINADIIAQGLNASYDNVTAIESGRIMLDQINELFKKGQSFAFETTLSGKTWGKIINKAKSSGYVITLYFVTLANVELAINRISERVKVGGHNIPEKTVRRRFERSHQMFYNEYKAMVDNWYLFDNTFEKTIPVAKRLTGKEEIVDQNLFDQFLQKAKK